MKKRPSSKRHRGNAEKLEALKKYSIEDAVTVLSGFAKPKFDETVNLTLHLGVDPRKQEQNLRGAVSLPHGTGKQAKVICFAEGEAAAKAKAAGAILVGSADLVKKIEEGWMDFDVAIAAPDMMRYVGKLGKLLGPQGKMPTPKAGTVTADVGSAVREFAAGKIEFRTDPGGNVQCVIGKRSFDKKKLADNVEFMIGHIKALKPATVKGVYIKRAVISASMSPGLALAIE